MIVVVVVATAAAADFVDSAVAVAVAVVVAAAGLAVAAVGSDVAEDAPFAVAAEPFVTAVDSKFDATVEMKLGAAEEFAVSAVADGAREN